jgi:hypothetical protein
LESHFGQTDLEALDKKARKTLQGQDLGLGRQAELKQAMDPAEPDAHPHRSNS